MLKHVQIITILVMVLFTHLLLTESNNRNTKIICLYYKFIIKVIVLINYTYYNLYNNKVYSILK